MPPRDRTQGNYNVLQNGVYTACEPCKDDPRKPPLWQVKAARTIHMRARRCFISKNASVEFFGVPLAYVPFMSTPDPTVKRKSGFLFPGLSQTSQYGFGVEHKVNLTSLTRQQAKFDAITQTAQSNGACSSPTADTAIPANCLLRGIPGDYTRFLAQADSRHARHRGRVSLSVYQRIVMGNASSNRYSDCAAAQ